MPTEQQIQAEFKRSVRSIVDASRFNTLRDLIAAGRYDDAVASLDISDAAFDGLRAMLVATYAEGGVSEVTGMRFNHPVRWNGVTAEGEAYARLARDHMADLASDMRAAVSWQIGDSLAFGRSANRTALDIVGRVGASGKREGGMVGLNDQRAKWVSSLRQALENGEFVKRGLLTAAEQRLVDKGNLTQAQIDRITQSYANRQLLSRGKAISRTERGLAINQGAWSAWVQAADKLGVPREAIRKKWKHNGTHMRERWEHVALANEAAIPMDRMFNVNGWGANHPHDVTLPASEVVNCSCTVSYSIPRGWRNG